ncbi:MAG: MurR/RpiR family transcriptional regulator [Pseudomonadota bacterium]
MGHTPPVRLEDLTPERLQGLSPQLRRAARFVVERPGDIATRSQRFVAQEANLPAPTFTRLAHAIGLHSYDSLRELCRNQVLPASTALADRAQAMVSDEAPETLSLIEQHAAAMMRNVQGLLDRIDATKLDRAAKTLAHARRVVLIGEMSARGLTDYAAYIANMSLTGWSGLGRSGESLSSELATLTPQDACLVVSMSPYAARAVDMATHVTARDVPLIAITDNALSPFAALAGQSFYVGTESPQFFPSHVPSMLVFETLLDMVIRARGHEALEHIAAVERQNHKLNEYWRDRPARKKDQKPQGE